jgi:hypothetical protein
MGVAVRSLISLQTPHLQLQPIISQHMLLLRGTYVRSVMLIGCAY